MCLPAYMVPKYPSLNRVKDSSLTYFPGFAVLCLEIVENVVKCIKVLSLFETSLMTSSI